MALLKWYETYGAADCMEGHVTFNQMINYIKHSSCTDFKIYSTCTSGGQAFRFTQVGTLSQMYGGTTGDLQIIANETNVYPYIRLLGDSDAEIWVAQDKFLWFYEGGIKAIRFSADSNDSQIRGRDNTIGDLSLFANTIDAYPYIKLNSNGDIYLHNGLSDEVYIYEQANERFKFKEHQIDFNADRAIYINDDETYIGHGAGDNIGAGTNNTLVGHDAGQANSFSDTVLIGCEAGKNNAQSYLIAIGYQAGKNNQGEYNTFVGRLCGYNSIITGSNNAFLGNYSAIALTGGERNTGFGTAVLNGITTGSNNVAIGTEAQNTQNVSNVIAIGNKAARTNASSNRLYINSTDSPFPLIYGEFNNNVVKFGDNSAAWNIQFMQSRIHMLETTTPGAIANYGAIYCKADNKLYFQDGAGAEHEVAFV